MERLVVKQSLPKFEPYDKVIVGSNTFGVRFLVDMSGYIPLIIGKGQIPRVWMYCKINGVALPVVIDNESATPQVEKRFDGMNKKLSFHIYNYELHQWITLIELSYKEEYPQITTLDLRPIGVNVYIEGDTLCAGGMHIDNSEFRGVESAIATR